jgi:hypothetical protein
MQAVDTAVKRRKEILAAVRKRVADAHKLIKKRVAEDLEEALSKCHELAALSAPPPSEGAAQKKKEKKKSVKKAALPPLRARLEDKDKDKQVLTNLSYY